jgi:Spy/CpxP family protein refolding chaperone
MKRNWLIYILVCSMLLNMGIIASFAYWPLGGEPGSDRKNQAAALPFRELTCSLNLGSEQRQTIRCLLPEHRQRIDELRRGLAQRRQELFEILQVGEPSWPVAQNKIKEIEDLQGRVEMEMVQFFLGFRNCLKPEQKTLFIGFMAHHLISGQGGKGRSHGPRGPRGRPGAGIH